MSTGILPPPPIQDKPGSFTWLEWYRQLRAYVSTSGSVPWYIINFAGSNITDIASRSHANLQTLQGGTAGEHYHLTAAEHSALSGTGNHNDLSGLQGGSSSQFYHLTSSEYTNLGQVTVGTWIPTYTNLTVVLGTGSVGKAGSYTRINNVVFYTIRIACTGTATTASTAGSTYFDLPIDPTGYSDTVTVSNKTTNIGLGIGHLDGTNKRCYPCSWTATGDFIVISGKYEV